MALAEICAGLDDSLIVGVIIGCQNLSQRGVWNFTFRDSEADFANVAVWGSPTYIGNCAEQFHIGDVVSVTKARIAVRVTGGSEDNFRPAVSSPFQLTLSEGSSEIQHHYLPDAQHFQSLIHVPTKQSSDITPLRDISSSGDLMQGNYVNILVAVQNVQRVRQLKLQDGRQIECREIVVFDRTSHGLSVQLPFQLTLTEGSSEIQHHYLPDAQHFQSLIHVPTKQSSDITPLRDIKSSGDLMQGNYVNILVAVQNVQRVRQLKLQDGSQIECREIVVFDRTSNGLSVQLWDKEIIYQASQWKPRETILFIADIILKWSGYRNASSPTVNSKTIITVDPQTEDAECLRAYARAAPLQPSAIIDYLTSNITDASSIRNVLSVRTVLSRGWADVKNSVSEDEQQFTALVYAVVTHLDLHHDNVVQLKCASCNKVTSVENSCSNLDCPVEQGSETFVPRRMFNIRIDLSDHTGTLKGCRLTAETAETVLGCTVLEFGSMTDQQKDILKWNFLMERCAARILVLKASHERRQPYISLISCSIADISEVAAKIPIL
ncbi:meiosis-specific with OB domain-containing protein-like [Frankliniella occidentalis]|uniref:Meiosis-specific with OB domain-containing protein-like n=1 Tax=Frankliniella occidentalis TaxID=133901 RepID=A0A9C6XRM3_FRAOC|nr:meiosis-specific with OB domain-containing protein-like [Frankliniella occidentalis]